LPLLFSYGTLQQEAVQLELFGRRLAGRPGDLTEYELTTHIVADSAFAARSGTSRHANLRFTGRDESRVAGTVLEVTEQDLEMADRYEPPEYQRVPARLASGESVWIYVVDLSRL
jgi:gamma-glutamylcyclotransferase (GGCT)/AIG2-like uncharacterized protein YtfP